MNQGDKIFANTPSSGSPLGFNTLFARLENLRQTHYNAGTQINKSSISSPFSTTVASAGNKITQANIQQLQTNLNTLKRSTWYQTWATYGYSTSDTYVPTQSLSSQANFTIPSAGALIKATDFNTLDSQLKTLEGICPVYSGKYTVAYSDAYFGFYWNEYSAQYTSQYNGQYSSQYNGNYGSRYSSQYSGNYGSRYGAYSDKYSNRYSFAYEKT